MKYKVDRVENILLIRQKFSFSFPLQPIPVASLSKTWDCGQCIVGIAGSNPASDMDVCLL